MSPPNKCCALASIMKQSLASLSLVKYLTWMVLAIAILYLTVAWLWKPAFIWGENRGIYWLLFVFDWAVLPLAIISLLGFIGAVLILLVRLVHRQSGLRPWALTSGVLLVASLMLLVASFPAIISPSTHLGSTSAHGRVYHISGIIALMDINYALYECDGLGFICQQIYRSGDYSLTGPMRAKLVYDASTNTLAVDVEGQGIIYVYNLK